MDFRSVLARPELFDVWQHVVGAENAKRRFVRECILLRREQRIIEFGCGTGALCRYLPSGYDYLGLDISEAYITAARRRFPDRSFAVGDIGDPDSLAGLEKAPGLVVCFGVLHHLGDDAARRALVGAGDILGSEREFLAVEPCRYPNMTRIETVMKNTDRGKYVRNSAQYEALFRTVFESVTVNIKLDWMTMRYGLAVIEGRLP